MVHIIVRRGESGTPRLMTLKLRGRAGKGTGGRTLLVPGLGMSEKSQIRDVLDKFNETNGEHFDQADVERQVEDAVRGDRTPSMRRRVKTGYWSERDQREGVIRKDGG